MEHFECCARFGRVIPLERQVSLSFLAVAYSIYGRDSSNPTHEDGLGEKLFFYRI